MPERCLRGGRNKADGQTSQTAKSEARQRRIERAQDGSGARTSECPGQPPVSSLQSPVSRRLMHNACARSLAWPLRLGRAHHNNNNSLSVCRWRGGRAWGRCAAQCPRIGRWSAQRMYARYVESRLSRLLLRDRSFDSGGIPPRARWIRGGRCGCQDPVASRLGTEVREGMNGRARGRERSGCACWASVWILAGRHEAAHSQVLLPTICRRKVRSSLIGGAQNQL